MNFFNNLANTLQNNQLVSGGILLMVVGGLIASLHQLPRYIFNLIKAQIILSVEIAGSDEAYSWLITWLTSLRSQKNARSLLLKSIRVAALNNGQVNPAQDLKLVFIPNVGIHFFRFKGRLFWFTLRRERVKASETMLGWDEALTISTFGGRRKLIAEMVAHAKEYVIPTQGYIEIMSHRWGSWNVKAQKRTRKLEQLILDGDTAKFLVEDIQAFLQSEEWYFDKGIPWRRGYLLYGPPGTGKSSLIEVVAGIFNFRICLLELRGMTDNDLMDALALVPPGSIIAIEDLDVMYRDRHEVTDKVVPSYAALLNGIDGISAQEGRILFMTTNYKERLDNALIRAGRADVHLYLDYASRSQIVRMYLKFFPNEHQSAVRFAQSLPDKQLSMAQIQEHLVRYKSSAQQAIEQAPYLAAKQ